MPTTAASGARGPPALALPATQLPASAAAPASSTASAAQAARRSPAPTPRSSCSRAPYDLFACRHREASHRKRGDLRCRRFPCRPRPSRPATQDRQPLDVVVGDRLPRLFELLHVPQRTPGRNPWISRDSSSSDFASVPELFRNHSRSSPSHPSCSAVRNQIPSRVASGVFGFWPSDPRTRVFKPKLRTEVWRTAQNNFSKAITAAAQPDHLRDLFSEPIGNHGRANSGCESGIRIFMDRPEGPAIAR